MQLRINLHPTVITAKTKSDLMKLITDHKETELGHHHYGWLKCSRAELSIRGALIPNVSSITGNVKRRVRFYNLQKFNAKFKNEVLSAVSRPGVKVIDNTCVRESHWLANVYELEMSTLLYMNAVLVQHDRYFEFVPVTN